MNFKMQSSRKKRRPPRKVVDPTGNIHGVLEKRNLGQVASFSGPIPACSLGSPASHRLDDIFRYTPRTVGTVRRSRRPIRSDISRGFPAPKRASPARPAPSEPRQGRKAAAVGGRSGALRVACPFSFAAVTDPSRPMGPNRRYPSSFSRWRVDDSTNTASSLPPSEY